MVNNPLQNRQQLVDEAIARVDEALLDKKVAKSICETCDGEGRSNELPICQRCLGLGVEWRSGAEQFDGIVSKSARELALSIHHDCVIGALDMQIAKDTREQRTKVLNRVTTIVRTVPDAADYFAAYDEMRGTGEFGGPGKSPQLGRKFRNEVWPEANL